MVKKEKEKIIDQPKGEVELSADKILFQIANSLEKEKSKRSKSKKDDAEGPILLNKEYLISKGTFSPKVTMSKELATLKCLIQEVVRDEIKRLKQD